MVAGEDDGGQCRDGQPEVVTDLLLQLPGLPASAPKRDQGILRSLALRDIDQDIPGHGDTEFVCYWQSVLPVAARLVQDKALVLFHRAAAHDMLAMENQVSDPGGGVDIQLRHQLCYAQTGGLVDDQPQ